MSPTRFWRLPRQTKVSILSTSVSQQCRIGYALYKQRENATDLYDLQTAVSPIKWQTRVVSCYPDGTGFAVGTTGGRTAIRYLSALLLHYLCNTDINTRGIRYIDEARQK